MKKRVFKKLIPILLILFAFVYWCATNHLWFPFESQSILVDGKPLYEDYVPVKSLKGDLFLRNQDNQPQYLVSLTKHEVSIISQDFDFVDFGVLFTRQALSQTTSTDIKSKLNTDLIINRDFIEFTDIWGRRWRVPK